MKPTKDSSTASKSTLHSIATIHEVCGHEPRNIISPDRHAVHIDDQADDDAHPSGTHKLPKVTRANSAGGPHIKTIRKRSPWGALLSRTLPDYKGPHRVGVFDLEVPVQEPRSIGSFKLRAQPDAEAGFKLDTVLFSVFYPAERSILRDARVLWFPRLSQTVNGFLKMARRTSWLYKTVAYPIAAAAIYGTTFPASPGAPLKKPRGEQQWPLVIFSHGVGCSRLMYSSFCGELASRGYIVCAVEHRDGSGPSSSIRLADGSTRDFDFLNWQDVYWPEYSEADQPADETRLRHDQLAMRKAEIEEIVNVMGRIAAGEDIMETGKMSPNFNRQHWGPSWNALHVERPIVIGHSLGGSAALLAASDRERNDFRSIVAFDPAIQRLEPWTGEIHCPMMCINSEEFTLSEDFQRLQSLAKNAPNPPIYSIAGSTHPSFSDVFLIVPGFINRRTGLKVAADEMLDLTVGITIAFLSGSSAVAKHHFVNAWEGPLPTSGPLGRPGEVNWHPNRRRSSFALRRLSRSAKDSSQKLSRKKSPVGEAVEIESADDRGASITGGTLSQEPDGDATLGRAPSERATGRRSFSITHRVRNDSKRRE